MHWGFFILFAEKFISPVKTSTIDQLNEANRIKKLKDEYAHLPDCLDKNVVVEIGKIQLEVDRKDTIQSNAEFSTIPYLNKRCDITKIKNVFRVRLKDLNIIENIAIGSQYKAVVNYYQRNNKILPLEKKSDGFGYIPFGKSEIILLPKTKSPTANDEAVAFVCLRRDINDKPRPVLDFCHTSYKHPSGVWLSYHVNRKLMSDNELLQYDLMQRSRFEKLLVETSKSK